MKRLEILVESGELAGQRYAVGPGGLRFGRSSSNDLHIPDTELSRNHCLFEPSGEYGIRVTDLASANGTCVNGTMLGGDAVELRANDIIEAGNVVLRVVGEETQTQRLAPLEIPADGVVDLGLGALNELPAGGEVPSAEGQKRRRSPLANILWAVVAVLIAGAIAVVLLGEGGSESAPAEVAEIVDEKETLVEMSYEKVDATNAKVFRFAMSLSASGAVSVEVDDLPEENRHLSKRLTLGSKALSRLVEILADPDFEKLEPVYSGPDTDPPSLKSRTLRVVWTRHGKTVTVVNAVEPDPFVRIKDKLEAFTKNELGIWAMGMSRAQLVNLADSSAEAAQMKWDDREVEYGNIYAAVRAWREALFYLETVNPKPKNFEKYHKALKEAEKELETRYRDWRFKADQAINLAEWETAQANLQVLLALIPDREDDRYREASAKLMDVARRLEKGGK